MAKDESVESLSSRLDSIETRLEQIVSALSGIDRSGSRRSSVVELTEAEIDGIGDALERVEGELSDHQRLYLLGIFGAAAHHLEGVASTEGAATENLRTIQVSNPQNISKIKLGDAFTSLTKVERGQLGTIAKPGEEVQDSVGVGVGVACVGVDWSKDLAKADVGSWRTNPAFDTGRLTNPVAGLPGGFGR